MKTQILNSKGEAIVLNDMEAKLVAHNQQVCNSLGYEIDITTLTGIIKRTVEQKFFQVAPADYLPIKVGEGAWATELLTYKTYNVGDDFETGVVNTGASNSRLAEVDAGVEGVKVKVVNWAKSIGWSLPDLQIAARSGNWDLVTQKEKSRKKNWDLGIQKIAFLGSDTDANVMGLLTQSSVVSNVSLITGYINAMSETDFEALIRGMLQAYRANCKQTAYPTHLVMPEGDFNGLAVSTSENFPLKSKLERLSESLKAITMNPNFKILPIAYGDAANNSLGVTRYALYNYDEDTIRMDIPVDYTATMANSINSYQFQNVAYGQYTGVYAYRDREVLYFDF